jgi:hypothetical protein
MRGAAAAGATGALMRVISPLDSLVDSFMASLWRGRLGPSGSAGRLRRILQMNTFFRCALACALLVAVAARAATAAVAPPSPPAPPPAVAAAASPSAANAQSSAVDKRVIEDGKVRIEEVRVRGQTQSVTVTSKLPGVKAYEVIQPPLGKDPSQDKGAAGKRTWSLFDF